MSSDVIDPGAVEAVCFDLDDTLFDFTQYVRAGLEDAAEEIERRTGERLHEELLELYFEEGVREGTFDRLLDRHNLSVPVDALVEAYHDPVPELTPYPDAEAALARLDRRFDLGLVTDGRNGREKLDRLGLAAYFDTVVVAHDRGLQKRDHPEAFLDAIESLDTTPASTVYVGDNPRTDFHVPNELGMTTVRIRRGRYRDRAASGDAVPNAVVASLDALVDRLSAP